MMHQHRTPKIEREPWMKNSRSGAGYQGLGYALVQQESDEA